MWMTLPPAASIRAAAAITSITMNGGTSLRADGVISDRAESSIIELQAIRQRVSAPPRCCRIRPLLTGSRQGNDDVQRHVISARVDPAGGRH